MRSFARKFLMINDAKEGGIYDSLNCITPNIPLPFFQCFIVSFSFFLSFSLIVSIIIRRMKGSCIVCHTSSNYFSQKPDLTRKIMHQVSPTATNFSIYLNTVCVLWVAAVCVCVSLCLCDFRNQSRVACVARLQ